MDISNKYSLYVGTTRGALSYINLDPKGTVYNEFAPQASEISAMIWGRNEYEIITGFKNGNICMYDTISQTFSNTLDHFKNRGSVIGLGCINEKILAGFSKGSICVLKGNKEKDNIVTITSENSTVNSCVQNMNNPNILATGGEMNDLKLWDMETKKCIFQAKSLGHDHLNLPIKASVRDIIFIPEENNVCCCASQEGHILLYDDRVQRKPVCKFFDQKACFITVAPTYRHRNIVAGTTKGYMQHIDMRSGKPLKTFTNIGGSVTCILCDPVEPYVATTSLDRYLRIFNLDTKEVIYKQYLKQSLTKLLMKPSEENESQEEIESVVEDEEYEDIFNNMEVITEKPKGKRNSAPVKVKSKKIKASK